MQNRSKKLLWLAIVLIVCGVIGWIILGGKSSGAAEKYKAELRAKGEKISFADLGFPKPPEDGAGIMRLTNAASRISLSGLSAGSFTSPSFAGPGRQRVLWMADGMERDQAPNRVSFRDVSALLAAVSNELAEIRVAVEQPLRWFQFHPAGYFTNFAGVTKYPFVEMRNAAQSLYLDGIAALHAGDLVRARQDHRALIQLTELNREDPTLVAAMIRIAISGLNLQFTWQVLQHPNWTESDLLAMQRDWERVDLLAAVETGLTGERAATEMIFTTTRERGLGWIQKAMNPGAPSKPLDTMRDSFLGMLWNADEDELMALRHHQTTLEAIRAFRAGGTWLEAHAAIKSQQQALNQAFGSANGLDRFKYQVSAIALPNLSKATQTAVRSETLRRLTVAAIALQRFHLRHQRWPETLAELAPEFLATVPVDPMSAEPVRYRREADGGFVLYSVGEDGKDNSGDPTPPNNLSKADPWNGLDYVWPKPGD